MAHERSPFLDGTVKESNIHWENWAAHAFVRAQAEDKLIVLDLTAIWCHACHVMDETTYVDVQVVKLLNTSFIPVRVETDQRPDIAARYKFGGWPTTSILLPSGEILFQANSLTPEELLMVLEDTQTLYRDYKLDLLERAGDVWQKVKAAQQAQVRAEGLIHIGMVDHMLSVIKQNFDQVNGGFRDTPKFFEPDAIAFAFETHYWRQDHVAQEMALVTLDQQMQLFDPVWGGFYRYAEAVDWTVPHYEKMVAIQAQNILNYLEAYQITNNPHYRQVVEGTIRYVTRFLADRQQGGFFASQDADVWETAELPSFVSGNDYFKLDEVQRLTIGLPYTDRSIYTGWNGLMATSYLKVSHVFGNPQLREFALKTLNRLFDERYRSGKGMAHVLREGRLQEFGLLEDQVWFAEALVEGYMTTGLSVYRDRAEHIVHDVVDQLEDIQGGGFFDRPPDSFSHGLLKFPYKDVNVNASLARLVSDLFHCTQNTVYRDLAKQVLQFVTGRIGPLPAGNVGLALNRYLRYPVHIVVVGGKQDPAATILFRKALELYVPGKVVRQLDPQVDRLSLGDVTFPHTKVSQAYICTNQLCSSPIDNAELLGAHLEEMQAGLLESSELFPFQ